jgi:hypothetical protein
MPHDDWDDDEDWSDDPDEALDDPLDDAEAARCPECGAWIYDLIDKCPKCGYWLSGVDRLGMWPTQPTWIRRTAVVALIAFLASVFAGALILF